VSLGSFTADAQLDPQIFVHPSETSDQANSQLSLLSRLVELIDSELTERQWTAITAELGKRVQPAESARYSQPPEETQADFTL
jgi:hypothetical protein